MVKKAITSLSLLHIIIACLPALLASCANMASPGGGPYDDTPPKLIRSTPPLGSTHYKGRKIEVVFDELVSLEKASENVIITPPQRTLPAIYAAGKKVIVELKDTLADETTYTVDFTNAIVDNAEKNAVENFSFAFSTGAIVDSMQVSGTLLNAANLEPMPGILVGIHRDTADTAFRTKPFLRTSKTNDRGRFTIRNMAPGSYRLYALNDANRDYLFDQPGEAIGFLDTLIIPTSEAAIRMDTVWKDSLTVDTVRTVSYTRFLPDNIVLRLFHERFTRQYMLRPERPQPHLFALKFNAPVDSLPQLSVLGSPTQQAEWHILQMAENRTVLNYWIVDTVVAKSDTLRLEVRYLKSDSLNRLQAQIDTVVLTNRKLPARSRRRARQEPEPPPALGIQLKGTSEPYDTVAITFSEPVPPISAADIVLEQQIDTLWQPAEFTLRPDTLNPLVYYIDRTWRYDEVFRLHIDSARIRSRYGHTNLAAEAEFRINSRDEYGHLYLNISGYDGPAFVELLDGSDAPQRCASVSNGGVLFMNLPPGKYYARLIADADSNGRWDTGDYTQKRQPEQVYYSPKAYDIKANWEMEEDWNVAETPITAQKPAEITKNKPKDVTKRQRDPHNDRDRSRHSGGIGNNPSRSASPFL